MTVKTVWGRIQGTDAVLDSHSGDMWTFTVPAWVTGPIVAEFWAEDEAGNVSYRTAILEIEDGTIKCIRWQKKDTQCLMLKVQRPTASLIEVRPTVRILKHVCNRMEA